MQQNDQQYQKLLTEVIKKQIIVLGPAITLAKARNVKGVTISEDGTVTAISGNPQEIIQQVIDQFVELSGLIVKKTMEPILASYPGLLSAQPSRTPPAKTIPQPTPPAPVVPGQSPTPEIVTGSEKIGVKPELPAK